jgi:hypothetical protein
VPLALQTVLAGFRTGLAAALVRDQVIGTGSDLRPWSVQIFNSTAEKLLAQVEEFSESKVNTVNYFK